MHSHGKEIQNYFIESLAIYHDRSNVAAAAHAPSDH